MKLDLSNKNDKELIADLMTLNRSERQRCAQDYSLSCRGA